MIQIDMQMPACCDKCFALDDHGDYPFCLISQDQRGYTFNTREKRMPTCPLKAQEPVEPILKREGWNKHHNDYVCPVCDQDLVYEQNYCSECGNAVKWHD